MQAARLSNMLLRARKLIAVVLVITLSGSIAWNTWGPAMYVTEAEVLIAPRIPMGAQSGQYDVEFSRASTSDFIVDDLSRVVEGNAFASLVAQEYLEQFGSPINATRLDQSISSDRSHRGLKLLLRWSDESEAVQLIGVAATTLTTDAKLFYPTIHEVADLAIIDLASTAKRPGVLADTFDIILKLCVAAIVLLALIVWSDLVQDRLYREDAEQLLGIKILGRLD